MKNNGFRILLTVLFMGLCVYELYPSIQNYFISSRLNSLEGDELAAYREENNSTIRYVQEESLKLGLDLLGGMHVTLEVRLDALIRELATDRDELFDDVLTTARQEAVSGDASLIDAFVQEFEERDPEARLSRYFRDDAAGITRRSTNQDIAAYLRQEADEAVVRAMEIIRQRVDRYGVTEPAIARQGTRRIIVELPGIDDPERVRSLLRGTARLEFRLMADTEELVGSLQDLIEYFEADTDAADLPVAADSAAADTASAEATTETVTMAQADADTDADTVGMEADADTAGIDTAGLDTAGIDTAGADTSSILDDDASVLDDDPMEITNRLLGLMQPIGQGPIFGIVSEQDTSALNDLLSQPEVQSMLPPGIELMYTASPEGVGESGFEQYYLLGVRSEIELDGSVVTDAGVDFDQTNLPKVTMAMNSEGARVWSRLTGANVGRSVAVVLDNVVYSYPVIRERIPSGRTEIEGLDSRDEASDIVNVLKSGALPAPVDIVEERTVGPSLGAASIQAGLNSVLVGLLLVALFMIFYYRTAGIVADLALIINIIFILGILAGFKATLTLPGIAGIVLTIGMAVDANVLIFERVREELTSGKTLKAAIEGGYAKALSAIFDANITTFFVGAILYSFGVGPIQGFAVTLMAGIVASLFSAIVITRIVFDYMVIDRRISVNYG